MEKLRKLDQNRESDIFFIRHAESAYKTYAHILQSENPLNTIDYYVQIEGDLTEKGKDMAEKEAVKLLSSFDSQKDVLFFVSSKENRALETARIYRNVASNAGFKISSRGDKNEGNYQDIREMATLSLKNIRPFLISIFTPNQYQTKINWDMVNDDMRRKWGRARKIVLENDYSNWGSNFYYYADEIKNIFPELKTPLELFHTQFKNLQRLTVFAREKISKEGDGASVRILAFGHEDYMSIALEKEFFDKGLNKCEVILL